MSPQTFVGDHIEHHAKVLLAADESGAEDAANGLVQQAGRTCTIT